ncbi:universal stress protein [Muricauda sp. SCSIO 64092]|uniref:universal stress protein n=1 Tax=Allomuricauda sp. SCSIO 64092 TaxID=2908842 RepID=UPI001FF351F3|nr:universal stress protein [Muricauda sp. SCSIO 64092]UOY09002.1 universal stress protein [Muricauda sp. SCSIO 64092]
MNKRILLPTDYSKNALNAIRYAQRLYKDVSCDFYLLNTYQVSGYALDSMMVPEPGEQLYETFKRKSEEGMDRLLGMLHPELDNPKHHFETRCEFNSLIEAVRHMVAKKDIDTIIMGTKGLTGSKARIFGTHTVKVMESIKACPVIAIPESPVFQPPREILFPTDYRTNFKKKEMQYLIEIAKLHDSRINVLHIDQDKDGKLNKEEQTNRLLLQDILDGTDYEMHFLPAVKLVKGINVFMESRNCDMLAFLNRKHLFFGSILSNPLVKEIGYEPKVPILELNDNP